MNILILGGAGFIGKHLCADLLATGHHVSVIDQPPADGIWPDINGANWLVGDFANPESSVATATAFDEAELVIHLVSASVPKTSNEAPALDLKRNVGATLGLLDSIATRGSKPKIVFISSGGTVYGIPRSIPILENHPTDPLCAYGIGKLAIEKYLALYQRLYGLEYCVLRLANPYGPWQSPHSGQGVISAFLWKALHGEVLEIWGDGSVVRDYIYIGDVTRAVMAAMDYSGPERVFNIGSGVGHSLNDLVDLMRELLGKDIPCRYLPGRSCDVPVNILAVSRAQTELGWRSVTSLTEGLFRTLEFLRHRASEAARAKEDNVAAVLAP